MLSIITINRNNAEGLRKTIESVFQQTFSDFEYIIVDGASTDSSIEIIQKFNDSTIERYSWISESDSGVYEAMNKGIRMATGNYLLFLNSGDFLVNKDVLTEVFSAHRFADFILGGCNISENGTVIHVTIPPKKITFGHLYKAGLAHQATFIKKEMFEKHGFYREDFRYNSDVEFWYRTIILHCCSTETINTIISDYNTDGISSKESGSSAYLREMEEIYSHPLLQLFIPDYETWSTEKNELQILFWYKGKKKLYKAMLYLYKMVHWVTIQNKRRVKSAGLIKSRIRYMARKIYYWWSKPIAIFACHQISDTFNPRVDCYTDWTSTELFEKNIDWLLHKYTFISLNDAVGKLQSGRRRSKRFAVFTFDDGYASVQNALTILKKHQIPATVFINTAYLDDVKLSSVNVTNYVNSLSVQETKDLPADFLQAVRKIDSVYSDNEYDKCLATIFKHMHLIQPDVQVYLTRNELLNITDSLFTIGLHGHEHFVSTHLTDQKFEENVLQNYNELKDHSNFIPYYAFPFGTVDERKIEIVHKLGYIPFLCNGRKNYKASIAYNRISIDGLDLSVTKLKH
jgi:glycosyltransferase involved in cell wall biosynthesis/peptidoglycan/xylan/chitin deacetylase (PgdA/CDA1 family)